MTTHHNGYIDEDFAAIVAGEAPLPNFEPLEAGDLLNAIACGAGLEVSKVGWARVPDQPAWKTWARYFFTRTQGGVRDGGGYVVVYSTRLSDGGAGYGGRFAICKLRKVDAPGANHSRGWHPGSCELCGLDMTVDSGD